MLKAIFPILLLVSIRCKSKFNKENNTLPGDTLIGVDKIVIVDKTGLQRNLGKITITDTLLIKNFLIETKNLKRLQDSPFAKVSQGFIKDNFGFYDIFIYQKESEVDNMQICLTVYNGVVIVKNLNDLYKDDNLQILILKFFGQQTNIKITQ
jgi:hypothetical protein